LPLRFGIKKAHAKIASWCGLKVTRNADDFSSFTSRIKRLNRGQSVNLGKAEGFI
jgi:hypothetical protein